jgi:hypothetical protein
MRLDLYIYIYIFFRTHLALPGVSWVWMFGQVQSISLSLFFVGWIIRNRYRTKNKTQIERIRFPLYNERAGSTTEYYSRTTTTLVPVSWFVVVFHLIEFRGGHSPFCTQCTLAVVRTVTLYGPVCICTNSIYTQRLRLFLLYEVMCHNFGNDIFRMSSVYVVSVLYFWYMYFIIYISRIEDLQFMNRT